MVLASYDEASGPKLTGDCTHALIGDGNVGRISGWRVSPVDDLVVKILVYPNIRDKAELEKIKKDSLKKVLDRKEEQNSTADTDGNEMGYTL